MSRAVVLALEVGGTHTRLQIVDEDGNILVAKTLKTRCNNYRDSLSEIVKTAYSMAGSLAIVAIGVSIAGVLDDGILRGAGNLHGWVDHDIEGDLADLFRVPVVALNDAQAGALGEYQYYERSLIYVSWGSGIGVALQFEGAPLPYATEFGHTTINQNSRLICGCGGRGHWEVLCGGANIPKRQFHGLSGLSAEQLTTEEWPEVIRDMAVGLRSVSTAMPGGIIVLGGGIAHHQFGRHEKQLQAAVRSLPAPCPPPELCHASYGLDSGLVGAAIVAWRRYNRQ